MAYSGERILVDDLLFKPAHSLIDQSLHARGGAETTSGAAGRWTSQRMHTGLEASTTLTPDRLTWRDWFTYRSACDEPPPPLRPVR